MINKKALAFLLKNISIIFFPTIEDGCLNKLQTKVSDEWERESVGKWEG